MESWREEWDGSRVETAADKTFEGRRRKPQGPKPPGTRAQDGARRHDAHHGFDSAWLVVDHLAGAADLRTDTIASPWPALERRWPPNPSLGRRRQGRATSVTQRPPSTSSTAPWRCSTTPSSMSTTAALPRSLDLAGSSIEQGLAPAERAQGCNTATGATVAREPEPRPGLSRSHRSHSGTDVPEPHTAPDARRRQKWQHSVTVGDGVDTETAHMQERSWRRRPESNRRWRFCSRHSVVRRSSEVDAIVLQSPRFRADQMPVRVWSSRAVTRRLAGNLSAASETCLSEAHIQSRQAAPTPRRACSTKPTAACPPPVCSDVWCAYTRFTPGRSPKMLVR